MLDFQPCFGKKREKHTQGKAQYGKDHADLEAILVGTTCGMFTTTRSSTVVSPAGYKHPHPFQHAWRLLKVMEGQRKTITSNSPSVNGKREASAS